MPIPYRRADLSKPGLTRRRRGRGFEYLDAEGQRVEDAATLARIKSLVIPPAWRDVWVCTDLKGHIQATGLDDAGRKQYLYLEAWRTRRDQQKFDAMVEFARALPGIREMTNEHLALKGMPRERALACAIRLLDRGFFRIGSERYAESNGSFGLATMLKKHVTLAEPEVIFDFVAKSGKQRIQSVVDPLVFDTVASLKRRRSGGEELLAYKDSGRWKDLRSSDVNEYLKMISGGDFSAKDFRTWHATVHCAVALAVSHEVPRSKTARKRAVARACKEVAHYLGNTPAVCRRSYIDPTVIDRYSDGVTIAPILEALGEGDALSEGSLATVEEAVLDLISGVRRSRYLEKAA